MNKIDKKVITDLLVSIAILAIGALLLFSPGSVVKFIAYVIGSIFILIGIINLISYYREKKKNNIYRSVLTTAIVCIVIGIIMFFCSSTIELILRLIMGGWILVSGLTKLILVLENRKEKNFFLSLIIAILSIVIGLYIILKSNLVLSTIGLVIVIYGIIDLIQKLMLNKNERVF